MQASIYFTIALAALSGLWLLWDVAFKRLLLDAFREEMFKLRFELFEMGIQGSVPLSSDTYVTMERLLNGLLRYGHRFTFMTYLFSRRAQEKAKQDKNFADFTSEIELKISRMDPAAQNKLRDILARINTAVLLYMGFTSMLFLCVWVLFVLLRLLHLVSFSSRRDVGDVLEREAYREMQGNPALAGA